MGLYAGENYTFVQKDRTNYFHPIHVRRSGGTTHGDNADIFYQGKTELHHDEYKLRFVMPSAVWGSTPGDFSVQVRVDEDATNAMTNNRWEYFCMIHAGMEGPIQILPPRAEGTRPDLEVPPPPSSGGTGVVQTYSSNFVDTRSDFDKQCGSSGLEAFRLPNALCADRFVCGKPSVSTELRQFSECLEAANCHMLSGMTTGT